MSSDQANDDNPAARDTKAGAFESLQSLRALFDAVFDVPREARESWLAAHVPDAEARRALRRLLDADDGIGGYLDTPAGEHASRLEGEEALAEGLIGQRVGPFRLARLLGKGGMAVVFLGLREGDDFSQQVAIKLLRRGLYSEVEQRLFLRERQVLANLSHPNIARLYDGGVTPAGIPYLVMEYVDGVPINLHADQEHLDLRARLDLFLVVCQAVEAAHRALIVHRDIKPSNILVTREGSVKLLDFGIAKLLDDDGDGPTVGVFTPEYAAPEQLDAGTITTATDVYALGVLLHELVTGARPGRHRTQRPSSIDVSGETQSAFAAMRPQLRGDLDNVLMKALATDADQRYASAGAFADDVRRHLDGQPVAAHPPSVWYRAHKFVNRHRGGAIVTAVLVTAVFAGLALALWQARVAREQAHIALQEATHAARVRDFVVSIFEAAGADLPRDKRPSVQDLVDQATARLTAAEQALPDPLRADLLITLTKVARSVGDDDRALALLDKVDPIIGGAHDATWLNAKVTRAGVLLDQAKFKDVIALLEPIKDELATGSGEASIEGLSTLGEALRSDGRVDEGLALLRRAVVLAEGANLPDALLRASVDESAQLMNTQHFREGLTRSNAALALWRTQGGPPSQAIIRLYGGIAIADEAIGDIPAAEAAYKEAIALGDRFFDKPNPAAAWNIGIYGTFLVAQGRLDEAEPYIKRGLEMRSAVFGDADPRTLSGVMGMAKLAFARKDYAEATTWLSQGVDVCREHAVRDVACPRLLSGRARAYGRLGRFAEAEHDMQEALDMQRSFDGDATPGYASILDNLVVLQNSEQEYARAIATADQSLAIYKNAKGGLMQAVLLTRFARAQALFELGRNDEALAEMGDVEPAYAKLAPSGVARFEMLAFKARTLDRAHRADDAREVARAALALPEGPNTAKPEVRLELQRIVGG